MLSLSALEVFEMAELSREDTMKVFDWNEAARLIRAFQPKQAYAGLDGDWFSTADSIYEDGFVVSPGSSSPYLASCWATPTLVMDGAEFPCWRPQEQVPSWGADTYWPDSALLLLDGIEELDPLE